MVEEPDQSSKDLPKTQKTGDNDVKKSLPSKSKKRHRSVAQEEGHSDTSKKTPDVGLSDVDIALKTITVKVRNKLLFNSSVMEGGWFDQVPYNANRSRWKVSQLHDVLLIRGKTFAIV